MRKKNIKVSNSRELPKPTYNNSIILAFTMRLPDPPSSEIDYLKNQFGGGLYAILTFTQFVSVDMAWNWDLSDADNGIQKFKNAVDSAVKNAKTYGVGYHAILTYGGARNVQFYKSAKIEDIRNAQWFNDNNLNAKERLEKGEINEFVFTTFSRYARKLRKHLETKVNTAFKYLKTVRDQNPELPLIFSAPGEAELNSTRVNSQKVLQDYFCDYSPFAVLEFRDWIKHEGLYGTGAKYEGEGYINGGTRYRGTNGLKNFNADFGTTFNTWDLKYYNWKLSDPVDTNYTDNVNPDPNVIPFSTYKFDGMMPQSGSHFIPGGFDPPRIMKEKGKSPFWDLFGNFRETMVNNYVKDMAAAAVDSGFAKDHYFTHQIPGDYLWGTRPNDPNIPLNERYYSSASPLWTALAFPDTGMGITMYDVNFSTHYGRTSQYAVPAVSDMSGNWGALEYNPEVIFTDKIEDINTVDIIYEQIKRLYDHNVHALSFFKWESELRYRFKGTNRESAARKFFLAVKDAARQPMGTVFIPSGVGGFNGNYQKTGDLVKLTWSAKIWGDRKFPWTDWGDFKEFVIYRGYYEDFQCDPGSEIARTAGVSYSDKKYQKVGKVFYKIAAVNVKNENGRFSSVGVNVPGEAVPVLTVSTDTLYFGASTAGIVSPSRGFAVNNNGARPMNWTVQTDAPWFRCGTTSGVDNAIVDVTVDASGKPAGTYTGTVTVSAAGALGSPRYMSVTLKVYGPGQERAPFGSVETPADKSKVSGSIPVTGWALDDIAVESVKIYRKEGNGWAFIGDAVFVEGARPDVESAYKTYPLAGRAGWGYLLLTNLLPNGGNGTFVLKIAARDGSGHETVLGTRTIITDNAHAVKPFGAVDTPAQGGIASGSSYINFGWALTPQPNSIPLDGSTIDVYIDGVKVGHPIYNNYREDIATLFPGYANSNGAVGYFRINTRDYADGMHTISWVVKDSAGNAEGIGSRYFTIKNE